MYKLSDVMKQHTEAEKRQKMEISAISPQQAVLRTYRNALLKIKNTTSEDIDHIKQIAYNALTVEGK